MKLLGLLAAAVGLVVICAAASGRAGGGSVCGSVDGGRGLSLTNRVAGAKISALVSGSLKGQPGRTCWLEITATAPVRGYSAQFTLSQGRARLLAQSTLQRLRRGKTRVLLALDESARDQLDLRSNLIATLRLTLRSPRGRTGSVSRRLTLNAHRLKTVTVTFMFNGSEQRFTVPAGVRSVNVTAVGARGGGGIGAIVSGTLSVHPGEILYVEVGGSPPLLFPEVGGYNGGGNSGSGPYGECDTSAHGITGGGGASDVRTISGSAPGALESRLLVAGGGGGGGSEVGCGGGSGTVGGNAGSPGPSASGGGYGGQPGMSSAGGAGGEGFGSGSPGNPGTLGVGGNGGDNGPRSGYGGGGGGGFYGGGGGGGGIGDAGSSGGGGGGGSSLVPPGGSFAVAPGSESPSVQITYAT